MGLRSTYGDKVADYLGDGRFAMTVTPTVYDLKPKRVVGIHDGDWLGDMFS